MNLHVIYHGKAVRDIVWVCLVASCADGRNITFWDKEIGLYQKYFKTLSLNCVSVWKPANKGY